MAALLHHGTETHHRVAFTQSDCGRYLALSTTKAAAPAENVRKCEWGAQSEANINGEVKTRAAPRPVLLYLLCKYIWETETKLSHARWGGERREGLR